MYNLLYRHIRLSGIGNSEYSGNRNECALRCRKIDRQVLDAAHLDRAQIFGLASGLEVQAGEDGATGFIKRTDLGRDRD